MLIRLGYDKRNGLCFGFRQGFTPATIGNFQVSLRQHDRLLESLQTGNYVLLNEGVFLLGSSLKLLGGVPIKGAFRAASASAIDLKSLRLEG